MTDEAGDLIAEFSSLHHWPESLRYLQGHLRDFADAVVAHDPSAYPHPVFHALVERSLSAGPNVAYAEVAAPWAMGFVSWPSLLSTFSPAPDAPDPARFPDQLMARFVVNEVAALDLRDLFDGSSYRLFELEEVMDQQEFANADEVSQAFRTILDYPILGQHELVRIGLIGAWARHLRSRMNDPDQDQLIISLYGQVLKSDVTGGRRLLGIAADELGVYYKNRYSGNWKQNALLARRYIKMALRYFDGNEDRIDRAVALSNLGNAYSSPAFQPTEWDIESAIRYELEALSLLDDEAPQNLVADINDNLVPSYIARKIGDPFANLRTAFNHLERAHEAYMKGTNAVERFSHLGNFIDTVTRISAEAMRRAQTREFSADGVDLAALRARVREVEAQAAALFASLPDQVTVITAADRMSYVLMAWADANEANAYLLSCEWETRAIGMWSRLSKTEPLPETGPYLYVTRAERAVHALQAGVEIEGIDELVAMAVESAEQLGRGDFLGKAYQLRWQLSGLRAEEGSVITPEQGDSLLKDMTDAFLLMARSNWTLAMQDGIRMIHMTARLGSAPATEKIERARKLCDALAELGADVPRGAVAVTHLRFVVAEFALLAGFSNEGLRKAMELLDDLIPVASRLRDRRRWATLIGELLGTLAQVTPPPILDSEELREYSRQALLILAAHELRMSEILDTTIRGASALGIAAPWPSRADDPPQQPDSDALPSRVTTWPTGYMPEFYLDLGGQAREDFDAARAVLARCRLTITAGQSQDGGGGESRP